MSQRAHLMLSITGVAYTILGYLCFRHWWLTGTFPSAGLGLALIVVTIAWLSCLYRHFDAIATEPKQTNFGATLSLIGLAIVEASFANGWLS